MLVRPVGFFLLIMGWVIVVAAVALLQAQARAGFVIAGFGVELLGLAQVTRSHIIPHGDSRGDRY